MPEVSIIIPCYNQGEYIEETLDSVLNQSFKDYEIIIIDDGSTDKRTREVLSEIKSKQKSNTHVFRIQNGGLANARNSGISKAKGKYILPLDSDDIIGKTYIEKAVKILNENTTIGIVYCDAELFGVKKTKWKRAEFRLDKMLYKNLIFCSALFRKSDWKAVGGYKKNMVYGWEDWDFWLSLLERGVGVHKISEILFYYRVKDVSMITETQRFPAKEAIIRLQAMINHPGLFGDVNEIAGDIVNQLVLFERKKRKGFRVILIDQGNICELDSQKIYNKPVVFFNKLIYLFYRKIIGN